MVISGVQLLCNHSSSTLKLVLATWRLRFITYARHCVVCYANPSEVYIRSSVTTYEVNRGSFGTPRRAWHTPATTAHRLKGRHRHSGTRKRHNKKTRRPPHRTAPHCPQCPQRGRRPLLPSPSACLLHYLKLSLVFICRAGDVASSSTFPSRAVYIREPIWLYKTRQQKRGGPEAERGETWKPFYGAANRARQAP